MAHGFEQRTSNGSNNRNGYDHKFDAPLIGDLSTNTNNNNNTNGINNPMIYPNDEHVHDTMNTMNHSLHNNQFYGYVVCVLCKLIDNTTNIQINLFSLHFVFISVCLENT